MHLIDHLINTVDTIDINIQKRIYGEHGLAAPPAPGDNHYILLTAAARYFQTATLVEVGTYHGSGALALSQSDNRVISYDLENVRRIVHSPANVEYRLGDFRDDAELILNSPLIFVDVDPHDGVQERAFHQWFLDNGYRGLVIWDDIHLNDAMKAWWRNVGNVKTDLTSLGHWSGTGLIHYA